MSLILSGVLFAVFAANVYLGATGATRFLSDVSEMLLLFGAALFFVAAILRREAIAKSEKEN